MSPAELAMRRRNDRWAAHAIASFTRSAEGLSNTSSMSLEHTKFGVVGMTRAAALDYAEYATRTLRTAS